MAKTLEDPRGKVYAALKETVQKYHFAPLEEGPNGRMLHRNVVLMALTYLLDRNHLLVGEPGWGKTTGAKIIVAKLSGTPYDTYDAVEIRGNPQKYEEKIVGRPDYGKLAQGKEDVIWQGSFGLDALIVDEGNRLPYDSQDVILQGIDTGRWNYNNRSLFEGKKPTFMTMNERTGNTQNGLLPALKDRLDVVSEQGFWTTMVAFDLADAARQVRKELCDPKHTQTVLDALARGYPEYKRALEGRPLKGHLTPDEKARIQEEIRSLQLDNDAMLFIQAFMAEINFSNKYGSKRASDPKSDDTHDQTHAGVHVKHSFSPRSVMAIEDYSRALAWLLQESPSIDHVRYLLPHVFAHKAEFHDDYKNANGNNPRQTNELLHLAITLVGEVFGRYQKSIQPMKNLISKIQKGQLSKAEIEKLKEQDYDHPLMKDMVRAAKEEDRKAFYE